MEPRVDGDEIYWILTRFIFVACFICMTHKETKHIKPTDNNSLIFECPHWILSWCIYRYVILRSNIQTAPTSTSAFVHLFIIVVVIVISIMIIAITVTIITTVVVGAPIADVIVIAVFY